MFTFALYLQANSHECPKLCKLNVVFIYFYEHLFSQKQFHKAIANIWFHLNILETNQLNGLTVPTNPPSIYDTAQRHQRELESVTGIGRSRGAKGDEAPLNFFKYVF